MATVKQNTLVRKPDTGEVVVLNAGEDVPEWAVSQVGDHLTSESVDEPEVEVSEEAEPEGGETEDVDEPEVEVEPKKPARRGRR